MQSPKFKLPKIKLPKIKLPTIKLSKMKLPMIKLPKLKWPLRLLLYGVTLTLSVLSILVIYFNFTNIVLSSLIYALAASTVCLSGYYLYHDLAYGIKDKLRVGIEAHPFTNRISKDYRFRTVLFTYSSLLFNLLFAIGNGIFGILYHSVWFGTFSAYYIVLSVMRFLVIQYDRKVSKLEKTQKIKQHELKVYQTCGILLILLTIALGVSVIQVVYYDKGHSYPGTIIFAVAAYTFYKITLSIINVIKAGRLKSPLVMSIRNIGYADAIVSILSLQTAMFISFDTTDDKVFHRIMNSMTGAVVCLMIFIMGVYMVISAQKQKKML